jgi:hypothetical protein
MSRPLFHGGETHSSEEMPGSFTQLFEPLPSLVLDLTWRPSVSDRWWPDDVPDENVLHKDGRLRAASAPKLVEKLLDETLTSHADVVTFLLTFESFLTPLELLDALASHFDRPQRGAEGFKMRPEQLRVITVVCKWLETNPQHFVGDPVLAARLFGWMEWNFREDRPVPYKKMMKAARLVYVPPASAAPATSAANATSSPVLAPAKAEPPSSPADKAQTEKEALRAAVRARMAAQNAVLGEKQTSRSSLSYGRAVSSSQMPAVSTSSAAASSSSSSLLHGHGATTSSLSSSAGLTSSSSATPATASLMASGSSHSLLRESGNLTVSGQHDLRGSANLSPVVAVEASALPFGWTTGVHQDLFEVPQIEIARQITLLDFSLFAQIPLAELHGRGWLVVGGLTYVCIFFFFFFLSRLQELPVLILCGQLAFLTIYRGRSPRRWCGWDERCIALSF